MVMVQMLVVDTHESPLFFFLLHLPHVQIAGHELYICVCNIVPRESTVPKRSTGLSPYDALENDIADVQAADGHTIMCSDLKARTPERDDYIRTADLQDHLDVPKEGRYFDGHLVKRRNYDKHEAMTPGDQHSLTCAS